VIKRLAIARELPEFAVAARKLYVPQPAPKTGLIEQFDGYFQLKDTSPAAVKSKMVHPNEYLGGGQGLAVPTQVIKQADVVMLLNRFRGDFPADVKRANWRYYEPRTEHGSSLSACAYAMVATEFGEVEAAYRYFLQTAKIDLEAKYKVYVGTIFMGGSHPAANGGAWMTAAFGFGGIRTGGKRVTIDPRLPRRWKRLSLNLAIRGDWFRVTVARDAVTIEPAASNARTHSLVVAGKPVMCRPGRSVTAQLRRR
jgi:kojibiose phosphorylase